ncbi:sensor histidine kinase [Agriterribacter humi]|uniref:sensor histidine kinase n=1 Tax=Agriterribacter humi TaxID=1104781 RepID=UPI001264AB33|nr:sensor histidine kinase [Agriterribacter humi]
MDKWQQWIKNLFQSRLAVHLLFCLVFILLTFLPVLTSRFRAELIPRAIFACAYFIGTTYAGRWACKFFLLKNRIGAFLLVITLLVSLLSLGLTFFLFISDLQRGWESLSFGIPLVVLFLSLGVFLASSRETLRRQMKEAEIADKQKESELELLRSQISPHFLFNTLNNLYGLSITQHEKIPSLIVKLSDLLRYSVYNTKQSFVLLSDELSYIHNYIDLEKIRVGERLVLNMHIEEQTGDIRIAPLLLIVFIENAFKHSKNSFNLKVKINIDLRINNNTIFFFIDNTCGEETGLSNYLEKSMGMGLQNTIRRLDLLYPGEYTLNHFKENNIYKISLQLKVK